MSEQVKEEGSFKVKLKKPKQLVKDDIIKVDLSKKEEPKKEETDAIQVGKTEEVACGQNKPEIALKWTNKYQSPAQFLKLKKKKK